MSKWTPQKLTVTALLIAIGILIPMIMPKFAPMPEVSFTLASHVAIMLAIFMAPDTAIIVVLGTTLGFAFSGLPPVVTLRAASHIIFAIIGSIFLKKRPGTLYSLPKAHIFSLLIGILHSACEILVIFFYTAYANGFAGAMQSKFLQTTFLIYGIGFVIHSMVDYEIAYVIFRRTVKIRSFASIFPYTQDPRLRTSAATEDIASK